VKKRQIIKGIRMNRKEIILKMKKRKKKLICKVEYKSCLFVFCMSNKEKPAFQLLP